MGPGNVGTPPVHNRHFLVTRDGKSHFTPTSSRCGETLKKPEEFNVLRGPHILESAEIGAISVAVLVHVALPGAASPPPLPPPRPPGKSTNPKRLQSLQTWHQNPARVTDQSSYTEYPT